MPRRVGFILLLLCLGAPSLWMLATVPPLWKDVDAYLQVTEPPNSITILHYAPAYCFFARLPLYLGYTYDCLRAGLALPSFAFLRRPILCDSGVFLLVTVQHAALLAAAALLILAAAYSFVARLALSILWAANPLFYLAAHCVGSETFSLVLILLLASAGLRLIKKTAQTGLASWLLFAFLLWLSILTRHIDNVLAALLPLSFILSAALRFGGSLRQKSVRVRNWLRTRGWKDLRRAIAAGVLGIGCIVLAIAFVKLLSWTADIPYRSRLGYTFAWRLDFLVGLSPLERERVILQAEARNEREDVRQILNLLRVEPKKEKHIVEVSELIAAELATLPPDDQAREEKFDAALNGVAHAFLFPPSQALMRVALSDFANAQRNDIPSTIKHLVSATATFFDHRDKMPGCAGLLTFRDHNVADIRGLIRKHTYLHLWKKIGHGEVLLLPLAALLVIISGHRRRPATLIAYPIALLLTGLLLMLANCFIVAFRPRFSIPMWGLTMAATILLLGPVAEILLAWTRKKVRRAAGKPG